MKFIYLLLTTFILTVLILLPISCNKGNCYSKGLLEIDSLMETNPNAAYDSLLHIDSMRLYEGDEAMKMRLRLLMAKAENKLFMTMPADSVFMEVVNFYDHNSTVNDRMMSRYLLGCIYRDMNDGAKAVECFLDAVELADTTDIGCDYITLSRICGQLAALYNTNGMYRESLEAQYDASRFAQRANNIYEYIRGKEFVSDCYYSLHDTVSALNLSKECIRLYEKYNMPKEAASAFTLLIFNSIVRGQYDSARIYMNKFENESGLFKNGEIASGREHYYYSKGAYYLGIRDIDSAAIYFNRLRKYGYHYEAYKGLAELYAVKMRADSSQIYSELAENLLDSIHEHSQANEIVKVIISHNNKKAYHSNLVTNSLWVACVILVLILASFLFYLNGNHDSFLVVSYHLFLNFFYFFRTSSNRKKNVDTNRGMEGNKMDKEIITFENKNMQLFRNSVSEIDKFRQIKAENIDTITKMAGKNIQLSSDIWDSLINDIRKELPILYPVLTDNGILTNQERKVCVLSFLGLQSGEISNLLDIKHQRVSNVRANINMKLFGFSTAKNLNKNLRGRNVSDKI